MTQEVWARRDLVFQNNILWSVFLVVRVMIKPAFHAGRARTGVQSGRTAGEPEAAQCAGARARVRMRLRVSFPLCEWSGATWGDGLKHCTEDNTRAHDLAASGSPLRGRGQRG